MRRMRLFLPGSILLHLNTGVACFSIPTQQQQHKHNTVQLPPTLKRHNLNSRTFLRKGQTSSVLTVNVQGQVWTLLQAATYNMVSVCSDENETFSP